MKIGVITDCFKLPLEKSIALASELGFDGVQIYATSGEFSPELSAFERLSIKRILDREKLEVSALCGDMGGFGFQIEKDNPDRIEKTKRIIDLACDFDTRTVTTHIGVIPADVAHPRYSVMRDALSRCGEYAAKRGVTLAIETGPESATVLYNFVKSIEAGVGVNLDPANFVMVTGQNPVEAVEILGKYIVHTHAKDGVMLRQTDPERIYGCFASGNEEKIDISEYFYEAPLGKGQVDFPAYIRALSKIGYEGYLTVERETGADPKSDIILARDTIKNLIV